MSIELLSAQSDFAYTVRRNGALLEPEEAVKKIEQLAQKYDIEPEPIARMVAYQERTMRDSLVPFVERMYDENHKEHEVAESRQKMTRNGLPRWRGLSKKRTNQLWAAYNDFVEQSLHDLCYIPYNQRLPKPETILKRIHDVSEKHEVDPNHLFGRIVQAFFPDWNILVANYSPIYTNLYRYFAKNEEDRDDWQRQDAQIAAHEKKLRESKKVYKVCSLCGDTIECLRKRCELQHFQNKGLCK